MPEGRKPRAKEPWIKQALAVAGSAGSGGQQACQRPAAKAKGTGGGKVKVGLAEVVVALSSLMPWVSSATVARAPPVVPKV